MKVRPVSAERWPDVVDLFERRGPRGGVRNVPAHGCWCMFWRDRTLEHARKRSAKVLEAYPHLSRTDNYMGYLDLFREHGFRVVRKTKARAVVRLEF